MKFKCIVEYEYPVSHKPPVKAELVLHGDRVVTDNIEPYKQKQGEWIPCSKRLPEKNGRYLASWVSNLTNKYNIDSIFFAYGEWDCCNGDVEAWMPLPEPYKGGDT